MAGQAARPKYQPGEVACEPAKFRESSRCGNLLISNHSSQAITVSFTPGSEEFLDWLARRIPELRATEPSTPVLGAGRSRASRTGQKLPRAG